MHGIFLGSCLVLSVVGIFAIPMGFFEVLTEKVFVWLCMPILAVLSILFFDLGYCLNDRWIGQAEISCRKWRKISVNNLPTLRRKLWPIFGRNLILGWIKRYRSVYEGVKKNTEIDKNDRYRSNIS